ncbi:hypothetical protein GCM10022239_07440 [Leifsonia bigeumensis]|uniref:Uncharacterized protein n=1 Tax=Leifsonella bigeumensis TaxID=433643 RepID=A0ABP7FE09_9MICO
MIGDVLEVDRHSIALDYTTILELYGELVGEPVDVERGEHPIEVSDRGMLRVGLDSRSPRIGNRCIGRLWSAHPAVHPPSIESTEPVV